MVLHAGSDIGYHLCVYKISEESLAVYCDDFRLSFSIYQDIQFMAIIPKSLSIQDISH